MQINFITLGDSTLDNLYWLLNGDGWAESNFEKAKKASVEGQIQTILGDSYKVKSLAYDGFTTNSVLNGDRIGGVFWGGGRKYNSYIGAKTNNSTKLDVLPLVQLKEEIDQNPTSTHYVLISVGGNDFRVNLLNPVKLLWNVRAIQKRYLEIVKRVNDLGENIRPILMFQYRVDARNDRPYHIYKLLSVMSVLASAVHLAALAAMGASIFAFSMGMMSFYASLAIGLIAGGALMALTRVVPLKVTRGILCGQNPGVTMLGALMEKFYQPILAMAKKDKLPILDLPNSFNPYDQLYRSQIEPNEKAGTLIAAGVKHIVQKHDYSTGRIYQCDGQENEIKYPWIVDYPKM